MTAKLRVLRAYHGGRDPQHRGRDRAIVRADCELTLVVPKEWPGDGSERELTPEPFRIVELEVARAGDVNRHFLTRIADARGLIDEVGPDVLDIHEEPVSLAARAWCRAAPRDLPIVMYTAQNVDKRFPPPFARYETMAHRRVSALYPCTRQAASVARGKGFTGEIDVLPLGFDHGQFSPGSQSADDEVIVLTLVGRLVSYKGVIDAVTVLARVNAARPAVLVLAGAGPVETDARAHARALGVGDRLEVSPWLSTADLARMYRRTHVVLVPSHRTETWVEQFGRVIVEGQASGAVVAGYATGSIAEVGDPAAVLIESESATELAERVIALVGDPADYQRRRESGLASSDERTWEAVGRRQAELYRRAATDALSGAALPIRPAARRAAARLEFGPTASTTAGLRPFALPLLRRGGVAPAVAARVVDRVADVRALLERRLRALSAD